MALVDQLQASLGETLDPKVQSFQETLQLILSTQETVDAVH